LGAFTLPGWSRTLASPSRTSMFTNVIEVLPVEGGESRGEGQVPGPVPEDADGGSSGEDAPHQEGSEAVEPAGDHPPGPTEAPQRLLHHLGRLDHPWLSVRRGSQEARRPRRSRGAGEHVDAPGLQ